MSESSPHHQSVQSDAQRQEEEAQQPPSCWVCHTAGDSSDTSLAVVPRPVCACRGSLSAVHQHCIDEWVLVHQKPVCPSCGETYKIVEVSTRGGGGANRGSDLPLDAMGAAVAARGRRLDDDIPRLSDVLYALHFMSLETWRRYHPPPPSAPSLPSKPPRHASSLGRRVSAIVTFLTAPLLRRVVWWAILTFLYWVVLPIAYGQIYFFAHVVEPQNATTVRTTLSSTAGDANVELLVADQSNQSLNLNSSSSKLAVEANHTTSTSVSYFCSPQNSTGLEAHWLVEYQRGFEVLLVGIIAACLHRGVVSSYTRWLEFLTKGGGAPEGEDGGVHERVRHDHGGAGGVRNNGLGDASGTHIFTTIDRIDESLCWLLWNTTQWEVEEPTARDMEAALSDVVKSFPPPRDAAPGRDSDVDDDGDHDAILALDLAWSRRRVEALGKHFTGPALECVSVGSMMWLLGYPGGGHKLVGLVLILFSIAWRMCHPLRAVRNPLRRLSETFERRGEAKTTYERTLWFVTYMFDMLFFSVLLPLCGGYVVRFALGPQLLKWPEELEYLVFNANTSSAAGPSVFSSWLDSRTVGDRDGGASSALLLTASSSCLARLWDVVLYLTLYMPNSELPSVLNVLLHWFIGTLCLMTLVRYESSVMVPLFHPGVDLFFIRSVDVSEELAEEDPDFTWKFVLSQVFDADPLRVVYDFLRVLTIESVALGGFVAFPVQTVFYLISVLFMSVPLGGDDDDEAATSILTRSTAGSAFPTATADVTEASFALPVSSLPSDAYARLDSNNKVRGGGGGSSFVRTRPLGVCTATPQATSTTLHHPQSEPPSTSEGDRWSHTTSNTHTIAHFCGQTHHDRFCPSISTQCIMGFVFEGARSCFEHTEEPHPQRIATGEEKALAGEVSQGEGPSLSIRFTLLYVWCLLTCIVALCAFPMQRLQLQWLLPFATAFGQSKWLGLNVFLFDEERIGLVREYLNNADLDELLMPAVTPDRMFVRRERHFGPNKNNNGNNAGAGNAQTPDGLLPAPRFLKARVAIFALYFYTVSTVALWLLPILAAVLSFPALQAGSRWMRDGSGSDDGSADDVSALAIVAAATSLPFVAIDPLLYAKCAVEVPIVVIGVSVMGVVNIISLLRAHVAAPLLSLVAQITAAPTTSATAGAGSRRRGVVWRVVSDLEHALDTFMFPPQRHVGPFYPELVPPNEVGWDDEDDDKNANGDASEGEEYTRSIWGEAERRAAAAASDGDDDQWAPL